jgi:hypothetical protein
MNTTHNLTLAGALLAAASTLLVGCAYGPASDSEAVGEAEQAVGPNGSNNVSPSAIDAQPLKRSITNAAGLTSSTNPDPLALCKPGTVSSSGCTLATNWETWVNADGIRGFMMKGLAKCAVESTFTIYTSDGTPAFPGQWGLYTGWKQNRLDSEDKRERISACVLTLLNGNDDTKTICIIGPGGAPFSDACTDTLHIDTREAGFFGDLWGPNPTAYVVGPNTAPEVDDGRACYGSKGSYCCAESDTSCPHHLVLAGSFEGSPDDNYATKRCNGTQWSGNYEWCTSFYSTREPGRTYSAVFTTFIPSAQQ